MMNRRRPRLLLCALSALLVLSGLTGCGRAEFVSTTAAPTLPPPTPAGMQELPPNRPGPRTR